METKFCKTCNVEKKLFLFPRCKNKSGKYYYYPNCKKCAAPLRQIACNQYYKKNQDKILSDGKIRHHNTKQYQTIRSQKYRQENKEEIKRKRKEVVRRKRLENPSFRLKENISRTIRGSLKRSNMSKNGLSFLKFINYTVQQLKNNLETKFEPWMTWNNWGVYDAKAWDDNNPSTWKWQIDHIVPQSKLLYSSMSDDNFKKCWSLENLRPLSAKQNFLEGIKLPKSRKL